MYAAAWISRYQGVRNLYFSVNHPRHELTRKAKKEDIGEAAALHVDVDPRVGLDLAAERARILAALHAHEPPPSVIVDSGGGCAGFWLLCDPVPVSDPADVEARNRRLADELGSDHCHNIDRVMRLPGTVNLPNERKRRRGRVQAPALLVEADWGRTYSVAKCAAAPIEASEERPDDGAVPVSVPEASDPGDLSSLPAELRDLIVAGDASRWNGDRSRLVWHVCCALVRAGGSDGQISAAR